MPPRLRICGLCCFLPWLKQGAVLVAFRPVAIKDGTGEKHERYRRGDGDEDADEDLVENRATIKPGREDHRRHDERAGAAACSERGRMDTVIETAESDEAHHAHQGEKPSDENEGGDDNSQPDRHIVHCFAHSITSPRMRNLASAKVETNPSTPMIRAAS